MVQGLGKYMNIGYLDPWGKAVKNNGGFSASLCKETCDIVRPFVFGNLVCEIMRSLILGQVRLLILEFQVKQGVCWKKRTTLCLSISRLTCQTQPSSKAATSSCEKGTQWQMALWLFAEEMPRARVSHSVVSHNASISALQKLGRPGHDSPFVRGPWFEAHCVCV